MTYIPQVPFRRPTNCARTMAPRTPKPQAGTTADKWQVLRDLVTGRAALGLSDRDLAVLQALLSFHPPQMLDAGSDLVVFPSNASICDRLNGMPCSTMRRHLARLVDAGVLIRRDSPNGKRYARRYGGNRVAYGFDLSALLARAGEFAMLADQAREEADRIRALRERVSLMRRDLAAYVEDGRLHAPDRANWDALSDLAILTARALRRKLDLPALERMEEALIAAIEPMIPCAGPVETEELSTSDAPIEQHQHKTDIDSFVKKEPPVPLAPNSDGISLHDVLDRCSEIQVYAPEPIRTWEGLFRAAETIAPMTGIALPVWEEAKLRLGVREASIALAIMLERYREVRSPSAYMRALGLKALAGTYRPARISYPSEKHAA
ncbi:replication initiation protein [Primorskyibacter flagellatus]|uniref:Replication initiation protein n=1 Tax=Primorskyibacter flagellatus TaxID=1387277 RepID=A0A917EK01_9RHOB|nr:plasmid replication protein RepC [Primorskyibacter flagellatus]GGE51455.1 replication initiation protein [Primorskyibacter flagellatus]